MTYELRQDIRTASCMGGWCRHRNGCALYHAADRREPEERICKRGEEKPVPVIVERVEGVCES